MPSEQCLLVCVDGSDYTEPSLEHAMWLADRVDSQRLVVSHIADIAKYQVPFVNEMGAGIGLQPCNQLFTEIHKQEQNQIKALEERVNLLLSGSNWVDRYQFVVQRGRPTEVLNSTKVNYTHVVFGKRGDSFEYNPDHLGSNLARFLKQAKVPCLLSSRKFEPIRKVAVICSQNQNWQSVAALLSDTFDPKNLEFSFFEYFRRESPETLLQLKNKLTKAAVAVQSQEIRDADDETIIESIRSCDADLLVIGAHRESHFMQWMFSPIANTVLQSCRIPTLLCQ